MFPERVRIDRLDLRNCPGIKGDKKSEETFEKSLVEIKSSVSLSPQDLKTGKSSLN